MIDVNELLEEAIRETENLNDGEVFLVKDLFKGYVGNRIPRKDRLLLGTLFLNHVSKMNGNLKAKFIERYISEDLWEKLLSTYRMDSYENIWEALFLCHQLFRAVSGEVAERLHYAYPEYDRNITKYTRDMYKKYTGKTGCLDSTYAADIEERREQ